METGEILKADRAFYKLLGVRRGQVRQRRLFELFPLIDLSPHKDQWELDPGRTEVDFGDLEVESRDGRRFAVEFSKEENTQGKTGISRCDIRDITEDKRRETKCWRINQQLKIRISHLKAELSSANRELGALGYTFARHFEEPLNKIAAAAEALRKRDQPPRRSAGKNGKNPAPPDGENPPIAIKQPGQPAEGPVSKATKLTEVQNHELSTITHYAKQTEHMITELVDYLRVNRAELKKTTIDLRDVLVEAWNELESEWKDQPVRWIIHPLPNVLADPSLLKDVLKDLLSNAIKFSSGRPEAEIEIGAAGEYSEDVVVFVKDNGIGFDSRDSEYLFGLFHRLNSNSPLAGTGVGLARADRAVHRHGGSMWAESTPGRGATFYFSLPEY